MDESPEVFVVTGANGHLGAAVLRELGDATIRVLVYPGTTLAPIEEAKCRNLEVYYGDIGDRETQERLLDGATHVIHCAARIGVASTPDQRLWETNVIASEAFASLAHQQGASFVQMGSVHAFAPVAHGATLTTDQRLLEEHEYRSYYDFTKAEVVRRTLAQINNGLRGAIICPTAIVGPYDYGTSLLGGVLRQMATRPISAVVPGGYDMVDARDVAQTVVAAARNVDRLGDHRLYLAGSGSWTTFDMVATHFNALGHRHRAISFGSGGARLAGELGSLLERCGIKIRVNRYATSIITEEFVAVDPQAHELLGHSVRPLADTMADTLAWYRR